MKRLIFGQLLVLFTISTVVEASDIRTKIKQNLESMQSENCVETMGGISRFLDRANAETYKEEIKNDGHEMVLQDLWSLKITLHERLRGFHRSVGLTKDCADASRSALKSIRTVEDHVNLNYLQNSQGSVKFPDNAFEEGNIHVKRHPEFIDFDLNKDLKSGDVILTRGNAFTSAAIANLGEYDTQFSHMSMVYKDEAGKLWTVEAHIEVGSFVRPLEDHVADKNYRTMIYRFEDEELAARAAHFIFHKVKKASETTGNINYDFGFDQDNSDQLFCSEVVSHAIDHVSKGEVKIPYIRSRLMVRKPEFVKNLGITSEASFVPADIEIDPRFKIISEWRDSNKTMDNLQKDAILQAMFKWSDEFGYNLVQSSSQKALIYRNVAWPLRRVPFLKKYFIEKMPLNMSRELIGYFGVLESIGELLQVELKTADEKVLLERDIPLLDVEKYEFLDNLRMEESKTKKKLHKMFRPKKASK